MKISRDGAFAERRDRWMGLCGLAGCLSFLLIVGHVAGPAIGGVSMAYSGGGAVVLGIGATLSSALTSGSARLASSIGLVSLMILRAITPMRPDLFVAEHGELSTVDAGGLALLIGMATWMIYAAMRRVSSGPDTTQQPNGAPSGAGA